MLGPGAQLKNFTSKTLADMTKSVIEPMASDGLRTIGLAYKDFVPSDAAENEVTFAA